MNTPPSRPGFRLFRSLLHCLLVIGLFQTALCSTSADDKKPAKAARVRKKKWVPQGELDQDFPFQGACIGAPYPAKNTAYKGIAIKLDHHAFVCFDTDLLRMSAGWTSNFLNLDGVAFTGAHGPHPTVVGPQKFGSETMPGISDEKGSFADPRPEPFGPLPETMGRWNGLYLQGEDVVLSYSAAGTKILELPAAVEADGQIGFVRNFKTEKVKRAFSMVVFDVPNGAGKIENGQAAFDCGGTVVSRVALVDAPKGVSLEVQNYKKLVVKFPKGTAAGAFRIVIWNGEKADESKFAALLKGQTEAIDIKQTGPAHWPDVVRTKGVLNFSSTPDGAYAVDQLTPPEENPWKRRVRPGGFDFFADGKRAAMCTWDGDIWIVSGIDEKLENLTWKRFASGGYETLGLKIVGDVIYTSSRAGITRYNDLDGDGECDFYENFNNQVTSSDGFHEFVFDLQTDRDGNFYFCKAGPVRGGGRGFGGDNFGTVSAHAGTMLKVSRDGKKLEVVATGFRAPNGMAVGPHGELTTGDNEGTWVPACPINWVEPGGFCGVESLAHKNPVPQFKAPICWLSHQDADNSGGGQAWVTSDKWGPFGGELLHMSYGMCSLYLVMKERIGGTETTADKPLLAAVNRSNGDAGKLLKTRNGRREQSDAAIDNGQMQGGVVKFPLKFSSSTMRARFNAVDGQLYICGLQGWQTTAVRLAGFDRVRYTGKPVYTVNGLHVKHGAIELTFTQPLDPAYANDSENFSIKRWNYRRAEDYGSPEFSVADPTKQQRDDVELKSAELSADGKTITLEVPDLKPVMGESITFDLKAKDGTPLKQTIQHTINVIP